MNQSLSRSRSWGLRILLVAASIALAAALLPGAAGAQPLPSLSISDVSVTEGNSGTTTAQLTVTLSAASSQFVTVEFDSADETALFADADYHQLSGSLVFDPGDTTESITVTVVGDTVDESDESFLVNLSNPNRATIADGTGRVSIVDDDGPVSVGISDASVVEGDSGTTPMTFTISLSRPVSEGVTVSYATSDGTATFAGNDFFQTSGTVAFSAGQTSRTITVNVVGDTIDENDEAFTVSLSNPNGVVIGDGSAQGTIIDNDTTTGGGGSGGETPSVSVGDRSVTEGDAGTRLMTFTVSLSSDATGTVRVDYETQSGTAEAGEDFTATSGSLTFASGETTKVVDVTIIGDEADEADESLQLLLTRVQGALFADSSATGTILDDEQRPIFTVTNVAIGEGDTGTRDVTLTLSLSGPSDDFVTVDLETEDATATFADGDYHSVSGSIVFQPGETSRTLTVTIVGDEVAEEDEYFVVSFSNLSGASFGDTSARVTILTDDEQATVTTLRVVKHPGFLVAKGAVIPAASGRVTVKLFKKRNGAFDLRATRDALLAAPSDRDGDGRLESRYRTEFKRPRRGTCRITVRFAGGDGLEPSSARETFRC